MSLPAPSSRADVLDLSRFFVNSEVQVLSVNFEDGE